MPKFIYEVEPLQDGSNRYGIFQYDLDNPSYGDCIQFFATLEEAELELKMLEGGNG